MLYDPMIYADRWHAPKLSPNLLRYLDELEEAELKAEEDLLLWDLQVTDPNPGSDPDHFRC